jgi:hypothetical protein
MPKKKVLLRTEPQKIGPSFTTQNNEKQKRKTSFFITDK